MGKENASVVIGRLIMNRKFMFAVSIAIAVIAGWIFADIADGDWRYGIAGAIFALSVLNVAVITDKYRDWRKAKAKRERELERRN